MSPGWASPARILGTSRGREPAALEGGRDLVLHAPPEHGAALPRGVLLDDWLDLAARAEVDAEAIRGLLAWTERHDEALTVDGVRLAWVHQGELFADVFMREGRVAAGVRAAFAAEPPAAVELVGIDLALAAGLRRLLGEMGIRLEAVRDTAPPPSYPITFAMSVGRSVPALAAARQLFGLPARVRGAVLVKPFWHLAPLWPRLMARPRDLAVLDPFDPPRLGARELSAIAARGGWIGHPGGRLRRRSRAALTRALGRSATAEEGWPGFISERAHLLLLQRAQDTVAQVASLRTSFESGRIRAAVVPSDGSPPGRAIATAAIGHGVRTVQVQHGFFSDLWRADGRLGPFVDGLTADHAAVWSQRQAAVLGDQPRGGVEVTGNPAASATRIERGAPRRGRAVMLVQPPIVSSALVDVRAPSEFARTALAGLAEAGFSEVALRPHPLDPGGYEAEVARGTGLSVSVERGGPVEPLLAGADAVVGAVSTATLQAAAAGIPTVFLDSFGGRAAWPLDGSGAFPSASDPRGLAAALAAPSERGAAAAREALGWRDDALDRLVELIARA